MAAACHREFLPRDAMHKRGLCCHAVSVRVSITFVSCVKTNKDIFDFFSPSSGHTILVFPHRTGWRYSDGNPANGGVKCRRGKQKSRFWAYVAAVDAATVYRPGDVNTVAGGRRPPSRKLWHLYRWSYTAGIRPPSATRDKVTVCVVLQRESDQARSRTIHNHDRSYVWQQGLTLRRRQQNIIELYAIVNSKLK